MPEGQTGINGKYLQVYKCKCSDRRVGISTLLAIHLPEIQNSSISGSKIGCRLIQELVTATVVTKKGCGVVVWVVQMCEVGIGVGVYTPVQWRLKRLAVINVALHVACQRGRQGSAVSMCVGYCGVGMYKLGMGVSGMVVHV